jgi:hypothetical protein
MQVFASQCFRILSHCMLLQSDGRRVRCVIRPFALRCVSVSVYFGKFGSWGPKLGPTKVGVAQRNEQRHTMSQWPMGARSVTRSACHRDVIRSNAMWQCCVNECNRDVAPINGSMCARSAAATQSALMKTVIALMKTVVH